jgi:hypothetical protein
VIIDPRVARLSGTVGQPIQTSIKIIPLEKYPFAIIGVRALWGINIAYDLKRHMDGSGYILTIENRKKTKGRYTDAIQLQTDSAIQREIKIYVYGHIIQEPPTNRKTIQGNHLSSRRGM